MGKLIVVCGIVFVAFMLTVTEARKNKAKARDANATEVTLECLGQKLQESKLTFGLTDCTEEFLKEEQPEKMKAKKKFLKKNQMCIKMCQRKKQGILESNGSNGPIIVSETGANQFIEDLFPQKARTRIQRGLTRCAEDNEDGFSKDNHCKAYKKFEKCIMRIISKSCGWNKIGKNNANAGRNNRPERRRGNKGKNKGNSRQHHEDDHADDDNSGGEE